MNERTAHEARFEAIRDRLCTSEKEVEPGPMMSAPGIRYRNKVFAFFYNESMCFRLGKAYDPDAEGLDEWEPLNPFKKKPPLAGWFVVPHTQARRWNELADQALERLREDLG
jgi:hypothetical protein